jgi:hypothetical protein
MKQSQFRTLFFAVLFWLFCFWVVSNSVPTPVLAQQADTPVPQGMYITVLSDEPFANIRMGPSSTIYPKVGVLYPGDTAQALGRSPGGDWIQIVYPGAPYDKGWIYSPLVEVSPGTLQIVEPPPTPVPPATSTIDPTLAAQFSVAPTSTRLPTFTPPPALTTPSYLNNNSSNSADGESVSLAVIILALVTLGLIGFLLSVSLRR